MACQTRRQERANPLSECLGETLEPVSHCASDCVARHSSHRLFYDQIQYYVVHQFSWNRIQIHVPSLFRQIDTTLSIHCYGLVQTARPLFSQGIDWAPDRHGVGQFSVTLLTRQIDQMQGQLFSFPTIQIDSDTTSVDGASFMFSSIFVLVAFIFYCFQMLFEILYVSMLYCFDSCMHRFEIAYFIGLYSLLYMTAFTHWVFLNTHPSCYHMSYFR